MAHELHFRFKTKQFRRGAGSNDERIGGVEFLADGDFEWRCLNSPQ